MSTTLRNSVEVVEESLDSAGEEALELLNLTRKHEVTFERFDWLYKQNPHGPAVMWSVRDSDSGKMAGFSVALPRRMIVDGTEVVCWNCADLSVHPEYRRRGCASLLRNATRQGIDAGRASFLYAHPNANASGAHRKAGHRSVGRMIRFTKVLRTKEYLQSRLRIGFLVSGMAACLDAAIEFRTRIRKPKSGLEIDHSNQLQFEKGYDELFDRNRDTTRIVGVRDSNYLNWRYRQNPLERFEILEARNHEKLQCFLLFCSHEDSISIKDIFPAKLPFEVFDLFSQLIFLGLQRKIRSLNFTVLEGHPSIPVIEKLGFQQRSDYSHMYAYARNSNGVHSILFDTNNWYLTVGDRDV